MHSQRIETDKHKKIFDVWYINERNIAKTARDLGIGHMPIRRYMEWFNWAARADERDRVLDRSTDDEFDKIDKVQKVVAEHQKAADSMILKGMAYLEEHGIDNSRDAIQAIRLGIELGRKSLALPDYITHIVNSSNADLNARASELIDMINQSRVAAAAQRAMASGMNEEDEDCQMIEGELGALPESTEE